MDITIRIERGRPQNGFGYYAKVHIPTNSPSFNPFMVPEVRSYNLDLFPLEKLLEFVLESPLAKPREGLVFYDGLILESESCVVLQKAIQKIMTKVVTYHRNFVNDNAYKNRCEELWKANEDEIIELEYKGFGVPHIKR